MTKEELIKLGKEIKKDFEEVVTLHIPGYVGSKRYNELMDMLSELNLGVLKDHRYFDYQAGMGSDELSYDQELMGRLSIFKREFQKLRNLIT